MNGDAWPRHPPLPVVAGTQVPDFANNLPISPWGPPTPLQSSTKLKPWPTQGPQPSCDKSDHAVQHANLPCELQYPVGPQALKFERHQFDRLMYPAALRQDVLCQPTTPAGLPLSFVDLGRLVGDLSDNGGRTSPELLLLEGGRLRAEKSWQQKQLRQKKIEERAQKSLHKKGLAPARHRVLKKLPVRQASRKRSAVELESQPAVELEGQPPEKGSSDGQNCRQDGSSDVKSLCLKKHDMLYEPKASLHPWTPVAQHDERAYGFSNAVIPHSLHPGWLRHGAEDTGMSNGWLTTDAKFCSFPEVKLEPLKMEADLIGCQKGAMQEQLEKGLKRVSEEGRLAHSSASDGLLVNGKPAVICQKATGVQGLRPDQCLAVSSGCDSSKNFGQTPKFIGEGSSTGEKKNRQSQNGESTQKVCDSAPWISGFPVRDVDNHGTRLGRGGESDEHEMHVLRAGKYLSRVHLDSSQGREPMHAERQGETDGGGVQLLSLQESWRQGTGAQTPPSPKAKMPDLNLDACPDDTSIGHPAIVRDSTALEAPHVAGSQQGARCIRGSGGPSAAENAFQRVGQEFLHRASTPESGEQVEAQVESVREQFSGSPVSPAEKVLSQRPAEDHQTQVLRSKMEDSGAIVTECYKGQLASSTEVGQELYADLKARFAAGKGLAPFQLRFIKLQEYLVRRDLCDSTQLIDALQSMTVEARGARAVELEKKAASLACDEAREMASGKQFLISKHHPLFSESLAGTSRDHQPPGQQPSAPNGLPNGLPEHSTPSESESSLWSSESTPGNVPSRTRKMGVELYC